MYSVSRASCSYWPNRTSLARAILGWLVISAFLLSIAPSELPAQVTQDLIGFYFDEAGIADCIPNGLLTPLQGYLLVKNPSRTSGLSGWEAKVFSDAGIYLSPTHISNNGINILSPPYYSVGLQVPIPSDSTMVLAIFSVFATAPGGIYIAAADPPSLPDATTALYADGQDPGSLAPLVNTHSPSSEPVAIIGQQQCTGYGILDYQPDPRRATVERIVVTDSPSNSPIDPEARVFFPIGSGDGSFGFTSADTNKEALGVQDFAVLPDGSIAILDIVNSRVVLLSSDLSWRSTRPIAPQLLAVRIKYSEGLVLLLSSEEEVYISEVRDDSLTPFAKAADDGLWVRPSIIPPVYCDITSISANEAQVSVRANPDSDLLIANLSIRSSCRIASVYPIADGLIENNYVLAMYCLLNSAPLHFEGRIIVLDLFGNIVCEHPIASEFRYNLAQSVRAGADRSVVQIITSPTSVEVTRWRY